MFPCRPLPIFEHALSAICDIMADVTVGLPTPSSSSDPQSSASRPAREERPCECCRYMLEGRSTCLRKTSCEHANLLSSTIKYRCVLRSTMTLRALLTWTDECPSARLVRELPLDVPKGPLFRVWPNIQPAGQKQRYRQQTQEPESTCGMVHRFYRANCAAEDRETSFQPARGPMYTPSVSNAHSRYPRQ